jgi:hypothetical protein
MTLHSHFSRMLGTFSHAAQYLDTLRLLGRLGCAINPVRNGLQVYVANRWCWRTCAARLLRINRLHCAQTHTRCLKHCPAAQAVCSLLLALLWPRSRIRQNSGNRKPEFWRIRLQVALNSGSPRPEIWRIRIQVALNSDSPRPEFWRIRLQAALNSATSSAVVLESPRCSSEG